MTESTIDSNLAAHVASTSRKRAVLYLRVSTLGQVQTDYDPEGNSIPAQRVAGQKKATSLNADVVNEFVEPGKSATSIDRRPRFRDMIAWVKAQGNIDYIIVYHFNRVFRDSVDAGVVKRDLKKYGTRVVSTVLDMGEGPEASLVETIIHAVDQLPADLVGPALRRKAETDLVAHAEHHDPKNLRILGRRIVEVEAPEIAEEIERKRLEREEQHALETARFTMSHDGEGSMHGRFKIPLLAGEILAKHLNAIAAPKHQHATNNTLADTLGEYDSALSEVENHETLRPLLAALPERERTVVLLRFFGNMTQTQIAERVGVSQMHVSRLLTKTLAQLREQLGDQF